MSLVSIENVHKYYGSHHVLKGIELKIAAGEVISIIGRSGSGKSTLLRCINGLEKFDDGAIIVDRQAVSDDENHLRELSRSVGMVFQSFNLFPHMTVAENVMLAPRKVLGKSKAEAEALAVQQLTHVGLGDKLKTFPGKLSGGQQQRMAIARALAMSPDYMLFDEATSALDPQLVGEVLDTMRMLAEDGMTMVLVTHEIRFARDVSDRVAFFRNGLVHEIGTPDQVIGNPVHAETAAFLKSVK